MCDTPGRRGGTKKRAREGLTHERILLKSLLDNLPLSVYFKDKKGRLIRISKHFTRLAPEKPLQKAPREVIGKTDFDLFPEELAGAAAEDDRRVMKTGEPIIDREERSLNPDGSDLYLSTTKAPLLDRDGNIAGIVGITRDITRRKLAEEREEFLHSLLRHDLRNKAQIILGYLELLRDTGLTKEQLGFLDKAMKATREEVELIEKVRSMRRSERKRQ